MDNQLQSAALRQHSYNLMAAAVAANSAAAAAAIPFLSAAGVMPSGVAPTAAFVNLPVNLPTAGPSTGALEQFAAQSIMYPSAYLTAATQTGECRGIRMKPYRDPNDSEWWVVGTTSQSTIV